MSAVEITTIPRIAKIPIVDYVLKLAKAKLAEAQAKVEEVRAKLPEVKLPQIPEIPLPEKILALREQGQAILELVQAQATEKSVPFIVAIDAFGNAQLDIAEKNYEFIFKTSAEEIIKLTKDRQVEITEKVKVTVDEKILSPIIALGKDLDQRSEPILKYAVERLELEVPQTDAEYNYQRALILSKALGEKGKVYSTEQLKQIQEKGALVARVAEKAKTAVVTASASVKERYGSVEALKELSVTITATVKEKIAELPPVPRTIDEAKELSTTLITNLRENAPPEITDLVDKLPALASELLALAKDSEIPLKDKVPRLGKHAAESLQPNAEALKSKGLEIYAEVKAKLEAVIA